MALWGCLLEGVVLVPIDYRASADFLERVASIVDARAVLVGDAVDRREPQRGPAGLALVRIETDLAAPKPSHETDERGISRGRHGRDHLHIRRHGGAQRRRHHPPQHPRQHRPDRAGDGEVQEYAQAVPADPVPESAAAQPHVRAGDGHLRSADAARRRRLHAQLRAGRHRPADPRAPGFGPRLRAEDARSAEGARAAGCARGGDRVRSACTGRARWWKYRRIHRMFGFKFWAMVVGAAPLDPELEAFWGRLGFRGHPGLRPHRNRADRHAEPSAARRAGRRREADRGRGSAHRARTARSSCAARTSRAGTSTRRKRRARPFEDGWFHTGDIGELDDEGQLHIRGRKKEMIVTPEGLNVFPEDVERVLNELPGVTESAVVGAPLPGSTAERVQAVARRRARDRSGRSSCGRRTRGCRIIRRSARWRSGPGPSCRAPRARGS